MAYDHEVSLKIDEVKKQIFKELTDRFLFQKDFLETKRKGVTVAVTLGGEWASQSQLDSARGALTLLKKIKYPSNLGNKDSFVFENTHYAKLDSFSVKGKLINVKKASSDFEKLSFLSSNPMGEPNFKISVESMFTDYQESLNDLFSNDEAVSLYIQLFKLACLNKNANFKDFFDFFKKNGFITPKSTLAEENRSTILRIMGKEKGQAQLDRLDELTKNTFVNKENGFRVLRSKYDISPDTDINLSYDNIHLKISLSNSCRIEEITKKIYSEDRQISDIFHYSKDFELKKHVLNNPENIKGGIQNKESATDEILELSSKQDEKTVVSFLDSGVAYDHPEIVKHMFLPVMDAKDREAYQKEKHLFIKILDGDFKEINKQLEKEISKHESIQNDHEREISRHNRALKYLERTKESDLKRIKREIGDIESQMQFPLQSNARYAKEIKELTSAKFWNFIPGRTKRVESLNDKQNKNQAEIWKYKKEIKAKEKTAEEINAKYLSDYASIESQITGVEKQINNVKTDIEKIKAKIKTPDFVIENDLPNFLNGVVGWDLNDNDDKPYDFWHSSMSEVYQNYDHGTHVSGIITDSTDDLVLFPVRYPMHKGDTKSERVYYGIKLAYLKGSRVMNISMGSTNTGERGNAEDIAKKAKEARESWAGVEKAMKEFPDFLFVISAGNDSSYDPTDLKKSFLSNNDERPHYPSNFEYDNVLVVAASTKEKKLSYFSNIGQETVDVAAPGSDITSLVPGGSSGIKSGTSMAAPFVTRIAAKIETIAPSFSPAEIVEIIGSTVDKTSQFKKMIKFGGIVNEKKAIEKACSISGSQHKLCL